MFGIPPVRGGGLVLYATGLMKAEQNMGIHVALLYPGKILKNTVRAAKIKQAEKYQGITAYTVENPLPVPMGNGIADTRLYQKPDTGTAYRDFLQKLKPQVIHVHSLMGIHKEFFVQARAQGIAVVFTTHDCFGLCPTVNLMFHGRICSMDQWNRCAECCRNAYSFRKLRREQSLLYRLYRGHPWIVKLVHACLISRRKQSDRLPLGTQSLVPDKMPKNSDYRALRAFYKEMFGFVDYFHFNSGFTREIFEERLGKLEGETVFISHPWICDSRKKRTYKRVLRIGYLGGRTEAKGFFLLKQALRQMWDEQRRDFEMHVFFDRKEQTEPFIRNHKHYTREQLQDVMELFDVLAVPSICAETFGLVVLEAVSFGVPYIVSKYVGAKGLLDKYPHTGFSYDGSFEGLKETMEKIYDNRGLLETANRKIFAMDYDFSYENHMSRIINLYKTAICRKEGH